MTRPALSELHNIRRSMQKRLAFYMITLGIILAATLVAGLFFFNQLKSPREELVTSLNFRMEAFASDMEALWRNVSVMGVHLSEDMTDLIEEQTSDFSSLSGDVNAVEALQETMLEPLCQYGRQVDCSGAFVMLNTSLNDNGSFSGLYIQRSNSARMASDFLLYRGMADVGRRHHVMPHRKWSQEFDISEFPSLAEHLNTASAPIDYDCRTTALLTLPDTSERAILLTVPMMGADGTVYGLCGFSINQSYFFAHHVQPSGIRSLACLLTDGAAGLDIPQSLITYPADGFCFVPDEILTDKSIREGLTAYSGTKHSFVGLSEPFLAASGDAQPHTLTVLLPRSDYNQILLKSVLEIVGLLLLLLFFGVVCCLYYTRRYLRPVMRDIELLKKADCGGAQMTFDELRPVSARLRFHEQTITHLETEKHDIQERADHFRSQNEQLINEKQDLQGQVEDMRSQTEDMQGQLDDSLAKIRRLAHLGKKEIDLADYERFLEGYAKLSAKELEVCKALASGLSTRQCAEQAGCATSTIDTYRKRLYEKTGIHKARQLQLCYALLQMEQMEQETQ